MNTDREVINRILAGDTHSFRILIDDYQKLVSHIIYQLISNITDREEIAQEVFIKVYKNLSGFEFKSKFSTWIAKIAYNTSVNYLKKKKLLLYENTSSAGDSQNPDNMIQAIESVSDKSDRPDQILEDSDRNTVIRKTVATLPHLQKTIITLFHLDELSYTEIGEIMNLPEGTVKSYLFRARKMLKEKLVSQYQIEEI